MTVFFLFDPTLRVHCSLPLSTVKLWHADGLAVQALVPGTAAIAWTKESDHFAQHTTTIPEIIKKKHMKPMQGKRKKTTKKPLQVQKPTVHSEFKTDPLIWRRGHYLTDLSEQPGPMPSATLNRLCAQLEAASRYKVRFDYHNEAGRPKLLYLGDYKKACEALRITAPAIRRAAEEYYHAWYRAHMDTVGELYNSRFHCRLGKKVHGPNVITFGQMWARQNSSDSSD